MLAVLAMRLAVAAATVELRTDAASCLVDIDDGARIVSFRIGDAEALWNDNPPQIRAADWAHGGIPVCWPRFGVGRDGRIHGTAWRRPFKILRQCAEPNRAELALGLSEDQARLEYSIVLTDVLSLEMTTTNVGTNCFMCSCGFHPYLRVAERERVVVDGLDSLSFEDDPSRKNPERGVWHGPLGLTSSIDRIFRLPDARSGAFTLTDRAGGRRIFVWCEGASHVNIWNPGEEKNCPGVVPGDEWRRFACAEPILVGDAGGGPLPIPPGGSRVLKMTIRAVGCEQETEK